MEGNIYNDDNNKPDLTKQLSTLIAQATEVRKEKRYVANSRLKEPVWIRLDPKALEGLYFRGKS